MLKKDVKTPKLMGESEKPNRLSLPPPPPSGQPSYETNAQEAAAELIKILKRENHLSFIAGGWVRDRFLGRVANDVDICSSASIGDLTAILGPNKVMALHANTARVTHGREKFEVTRFKGFWKDPSMMSAFLDAKKRDFTINSLLFDPVTREVLDFVGGVEDINQRRLRMNSTPRVCANDLTVLQEDPVRIVRGVRFTVQFDLTIDPATLSHMRDCCHKSKVAGPLHFVLPLSSIRQTSAELLQPRPNRSYPDEEPVPIRLGLKGTRFQRGVKKLMDKVKTISLGPSTLSSPPPSPPPPPTLAPAAMVQGLDPEAKAGRIWRELSKISMLGASTGAAAESSSSSKGTEPPFARALWLFRHTGLLPLLFPFLKRSTGANQRGKESWRGSDGEDLAARRVCRIHSQLLPEALSLRKCSETSLPIELCVLSLASPEDPGLVGKVADMIQGVKDAMKHTPDGSPDMQLVALYKDAVDAMLLLKLGERANDENQLLAAYHGDFWDKLKSHPYSNQILAVLLAWLKLHEEERKRPGHKGNKQKLLRADKLRQFISQIKKH